MLIYVCESIELKRQLQDLIVLIPWPQSLNLEQFSFMHTVMSKHILMFTVSYSFPPIGKLEVLSRKTKEVQTSSCLVAYKSCLQNILVVSLMP